MSLLAALLIAVGLSDLLRSRPWPRAVPHASLIPYAVNAVVVILIVGFAHLWRWPDLLLALITLATAWAWAYLSDKAIEDHRHELWPLGALGAGVLVLAASAGAASPAGGLLERWMQHSSFGHLHAMPADRFLLIVGMFLVQLSTGNDIVRLVLTAIGALKPVDQPQAANELRGGRLLGPLERVFILGLGLAGQVTAAGLVIAAKGLIRFPELQAKRSERTTVNGVGIDEVTEYFLVGSFVSWLVALTGLGALALS